MASSPSYCRPQQIDRERLRTLLPAEAFEHLRFHEAVVVTTPQQPSKPFYKLLAVVSDGFFVLPLTKSHFPSSSHANSVNWIGFRVITSLQRVSPFEFPAQRGLLVHAQAKLYRIQLTDAAELFLSTFEPGSRLWFYLTRAFGLFFQRRILLTHEDALEDSQLPSLLRDLLKDMVSSTKLSDRSVYLMELSAACYHSTRLKQLVFQDQTHVDQSHGLVGFVLTELVRIFRNPMDYEALEYVCSLLQVLTAALFDAYDVPERLNLLKDDQLHSIIHALVMPIPMDQTIKASVKRLRDDLMDLTTALLLELDAMAQEQASESVLKAVVQSSAFTDHWLHAFLKQLVRMISVAPVELEAMGPHGSLWSLRLWRHVLLLELLTNSFPTELEPLWEKEAQLLLVLHHSMPLLQTNTNHPHLVDLVARLRRLLRSSGG